MREIQLNLPGNFASSLHLALYTSKKQSMAIIKLYKSISDRFEHRKRYVI